MRQLDMFEEYYITFNIGSSRFCTPIGKGFTIRAKAEREAHRLVTKGYENVRISIRSWC